MKTISGNYKDLEGPISAFDTAWQDPAIPRRQWVSVVRGELERYRRGEEQHQFQTLVDAVKFTGLEHPTLLDVGASSGFYSEVLKIGGVNCEYMALDYSEAYRDMARELFPEIRFQVGDARSLPFEDSAFDIVLSGCVLLHVAEYEQVIAETARVAKQFAIFHRTPVTAKTIVQQKEAYGVPCLEIWFGEDELFELFEKYGLSLVHAENVTTWPAGGGHVTYLLKKI